MLTHTPFGMQATARRCQRQASILAAVFACLASHCPPTAGRASLGAMLRMLQTARGRRGAWTWIACRARWAHTRTRRATSRARLAQATGFVPRGLQSQFQQVQPRLERPPAARRRRQRPAAPARTSALHSAPTSPTSGPCILHPAPYTPHPTIHTLQPRYLAGSCPLLLS